MKTLCCLAKWQLREADLTACGQVATQAMTDLLTYQLTTLLRPHRRLALQVGHKVRAGPRAAAGSRGAATSALAS